MEFVIASENILTENQGNVLLRAFKEGWNTHDIEFRFICGELKFSFSDNSEWKQCTDIISTFPTLKKNLPYNITKLRKDIKENTDNLKEIEEQIKILQQKQKTILTKNNQLTGTLNKNLELNKAIATINPNIGYVANMIRDVEKNLSNDVTNQITCGNIYHFSSLTQKSKFPKLSLILNGFGIDKETILKLRDENGISFFHVDISYLFNKYNIHDINIKAKLNYIRHMILQKNVNIEQHNEECPVCSCHNTDELSLLLNEHKITLFNNDILYKYHINGVTSMFLNYLDIQTIHNDLPHLNIEQSMESITYLTQLHYQYIYDNNEHYQYKFQIKWIDYILKKERSITNDYTFKQLICNVNILNNGKTVINKQNNSGNSIERTVLIKTNKIFWNIKIQLNLTGSFSVGAFEEQTIKNQSQVNYQNLGHGFYGISFTGLAWHSSDKNINASYKHNIKKNTKNMEFSWNGTNMLFKSETESYSIQIPKNIKLIPVVILYSKGDSVLILE